MAPVAVTQAMGAGANSPAAEAYIQAMQTMDDKTKNMSPSGDPSKDFVMMMMPHHQAAVDMAEAYLKYGKDPALRKLATDIVAAQEQEIALMKAWLAANSK